VVLTGDLAEDEFLFHATAIYSTGGMLLSGDDLTAIPPVRLPARHRIRDGWADADLGRHPASVVTRTLPARSGRVLACTREG